MNSIGVLFVCTGNTCRSPIAEIYFHSLVPKSDKKRISIKSAGFYASEGGQASEMARRLAESLGLSLTDFRSSLLTRAHVEKAAIIVVMTNAHLNQFKNLYPDALEKTFLLMEFLRKKEDIPDPYGGDEKDFRTCYFKMKPALEALRSHLSANFYPPVNE